MKKLEQQYESLDNISLIRILQEPEKHSSDVLEKVQRVLDTRDMSDKDIQLAKEKVLAIKEDLSEDRGVLSSIESNVKEIGSELIQTFDPISEECKTDNRIINALAIIFGIGALYEVFIEVQLSRIRSGFDKIGMDAVTESIPIVIFLIAVLFFANRSKVGWTFIMGYLMFAIVGLSLVFFKILFNSDMWISIPTPWFNIVKVIIYSSVIWFLYQKKIRKSFKISDQLGKGIMAGICGLIFVVFVIMTILNS